MVSSPNDRRGSWAKADTPLPPEFGRHLTVLAPRNHRVVIALIIRIATQAFPRDVGNFCILKASVGLRRAPVELRHDFIPLHATNRDCGAIIVIDSVVGSPYLSTMWCSTLPRLNGRKGFLAKSSRGWISSNLCPCHEIDAPVRTST